MGLVTLLAVWLLGSGQPDGHAQGEAGSQRSEVQSVVVDTSAVSPPLRVRHGSLEPEKIREIVSGHSGALRSCYAEAAQSNPTLVGTCRLRIVVDRDGSVGLASMQGSTLHTLSMERCLLQEVRTWRFPAPADGRAVAIEYPLEFRKGEPGGAAAPPDAGTTNPRH